MITVPGPNVARQWEISTLTQRIAVSIVSNTITGGWMLWRAEHVDRLRRPERFLMKVAG